MAWYRTGDKPLHEPMLTHFCKATYAALGGDELMPSVKTRAVILTTFPFQSEHPLCPESVSIQHLVLSAVTVNLQTISSVDLDMTRRWCVHIRLTWKPVQAYIQRVLTKHTLWHSLTSPRTRNRHPYRALRWPITSIPAWISIYIHYNVFMKLLITSQTSTVQLLKFGSG